MTDNAQAAQLAAFYAGVPVEAITDTTETVRGGVYSEAEQVAAAAKLAATVVPGSWQDLEARGIPYDSWSDIAKDRFLADQTNGAATPPVIIESDTARMLAERAHDTVVAPPVAAPEGPVNYGRVINDLVTEIHQSNVSAGWWTDLATKQSLLGKDEYGRDRRNVGELLCLVHSEISEAMEGYRKNLMDDKLPHRTMLEVELADALIRIFDIAGAHGLDIGGAIAEKRSFNATREDHQIAHRTGANGKKF